MSVADDRAMSVTKNKTMKLDAQGLHPLFQCPGGCVMYSEETLCPPIIHSLTVSSCFHQRIWIAGIDEEHSAAANVRHKRCRGHSPRFSSVMHHRPLLFRLPTHFHPSTELAVHRISKPPHLESAAGWMVAS